MRTTGTGKAKQRVRCYIISSKVKTTAPQASAPQAVPVGICLNCSGVCTRLLVSTDTTTLDVLQSLGCVYQSSHQPSSCQESSEARLLTKCSLVFWASGYVSDTSRQRPPVVQGQADKLVTTASLLFLDSIKDSSHLRFIFLPLTQVLFPNILRLITTVYAVSYLGRETLQEIYF